MRESRLYQPWHPPESQQTTCPQDLPHRAEGERLEEPAKLDLGLPEVRVVPDPALDGPVQPRLIGIQLPRMQIDDRRLPLHLIDPSEAQTESPRGEEPQIGTTGDRPVHAEAPYRGKRELDDAA